MSNYNERKRVVKSCKRYIETHLYDKLTLTELAQQCHVSEMSLRRYFNEIGGYSVHDYIRLRRIHMAARYLRHGGNVDTAFQTSGFASKSGFAKAFEEIIGVTPWAFAETDGVDLMGEPKITNRHGFHIVGYVFKGAGPIDLENDGAYYIIQDFPNVSPRKWARIGGGYDMVGAWTERDGEELYFFGPGVREVRYVPKHLDTLYIPGGRFAVFPVEKPTMPDDSAVLCENVQTTWYFALKQWLPDSDYYLDESRIPYEFYLDKEISLCVPIVPKIPEREPRKQRKTRTADRWGNDASGK